MRCRGGKGTHRQAKEDGKLGNGNTANMAIWVLAPDLGPGHGTFFDTGTLHPPLRSAPFGLGVQLARSGVEPSTCGDVSFGIAWQ